MANFIQDAVASTSSAVVTTDDVLTELFRFSLTTNTGSSTNSGMFNAYVVVGCFRVDTGDGAYWKQALTATFQDDVCSLTGCSSPEVVRKDVRLSLTDISVRFDGREVVVSAQGLPGTTLAWEGCLSTDIVQWYAAP